MSADIVKRIVKFNKDRNPKLLIEKYKALAESPFRFFRGTCHLFYQDIPKKSFLLQAPKTWLCGDLHLENFGSYKGDNRVPYFDMNDFDEAFLGPCLLDVARLLTSIYLGGALVKASKAQCNMAAKTFLHSYTGTLQMGYIRSLEQEAAVGVVKDFLNKVTLRTRKQLLAERIKLGKGFAKIEPLRLLALKADKADKHKVKAAIEQWAKKNTKHPEFFKVMDVAGRANGTGSIGIERYLVLVAGKGGSDGFYLLDVKQAVAPSALDCLKIKQPKWSNDAVRVIEIQKRVEAAAPAHLNYLKIGNRWFVVRELQPFEDKLNFVKIETDKAAFTQLLTDMGRIVAWNQLRSGGRQGSAIADKLIRFGNKLPKLEKDLIAYADKYAAQTIAYHKAFKKAFEAGKV